MRKQSLKRGLLVLCFGAGVILTANGQTKNDIESIRRSARASNVLVACHRGGLWQKFPENSIEALQAAIDLGVDFVEIDVRKTKDGQLILLHDKSLKRTTTGNGLVKDNTLAELKSLYLKDKTGAKTSYKIPTLKEALIAMKGKVFIKMDKYNEENILPEIVAVLEETGTTRQASFRVSLNYKKLEQTYGPLNKKLHLFPAVEDNDSTVRDFHPGIRQFQKGLHPVVFQAKFKKDSSYIRNYVTELNEAGYHVWMMASRPYFCGGWDDKRSLTDPENGWGKLIKLGVTIIETDHPEELLKYLRSVKKHH